METMLKKTPKIFLVCLCCVLAVGLILISIILLFIRFLSKMLSAAIFGVNGHLCCFTCVF